ncbi:MAG: hypothetical protein JWQ81_559 [Amycolatopsis sp.]|uniref:bifunctional cytochrome P450/NADPH--P450 reductase n=1 Tax=Amycolatopsis sp. TaxID=37632 RepID=UPI002606A3F5|nr:cytochrome P450 [Amycolatopsis sp.]MCU1679820.1 hypothetical protein [Amycolatopsis sp.]
MTSTLNRTTTEPIPSPPALPLVGHALGMPSDGMMEHISELASVWGPLFKLKIFGNEIILASSLELVSELCDESRFRKKVHEDLVTLRQIGGDGLFTAFSDEPNWRKAHEILLPSFSLNAMRGYHETMLEVTKSLIGKWDAAGDGSVDVTADMTRFTLDTIGLCGFGHDFESFKSEEQQPFIVALVRSLEFAQAQGTAIPGLGFLNRKKTEQFHADVKVMADLVDEVMRSRRASGDTSTDDLLGRMLHSRDPVTGELLDDVNIRNQVITFLIAGHETTSGALSFALYYLSKNPAVLAKVQEEVDALWGDESDPQPDYGDIGKLRYVRQVLNEGLRLWPTAPGFGVEPLVDTVIGGRYEVTAGATIMVLTPELHRDPVWGDNVELFDPERFSPEREDSRPAHAFKAFGSGERACIGRQFALHEATMMLALLAHRFILIGEDSYQLKVKETLTLKPDGFTMRLRPRIARRVVVPAPVPAKDSQPVTAKKATGTRITFLHGSNMGTCAGIARDLSADGGEHGFTTAISPLNDAVDQLPEGPVVIVAASYNGKPTDDAREFVEWLSTVEPGSLDGVRYALLGVGDRNWAATYQRIPTLIDTYLTAAGATALIDRGAADASGDFAGSVDDWTGSLWTTLLDEFGTEIATLPDSKPGNGLYTIEDVAPSATDQLAARYGLLPAEVIESRQLVDLEHPLGRPKQFLKLRVPEGVTYRTGDHVAVLPENPADLVRRAATRFQLDLTRTVRLRSARSAGAIPTDRPLTLRLLLTSFLELQQPATQDHVSVLAQHTTCPPERRTLDALAAATPEEFHRQVTATGRSLLDLLTEYPACELTFESFLELVPALRPRTYSISSSALAEPDTIDLMVSALSGPHRSGEGLFHGIASHFLGSVEAGDTLPVKVLPGRDSFSLLEDETIPAIVISAGTGLAPFRGAVLDRMHRHVSGTLLCYFGCDHPEVDYLHRSEFEAADAAGVISMRPVFSGAPQEGARFVQDRILRESAEVWDVLQSGGRVYVCGDGGRMAPGVREAFVRIHLAHTGSSAAQSEEWLAGLIESGVYVEDVWSGGIAR